MRIPNRDEPACHKLSQVDRNLRADPDQDRGVFDTAVLGDIELDSCKATGQDPGRAAAPLGVVAQSLFRTGGDEATVARRRMDTAKPAPRDNTGPESAVPDFRTAAGREALIAMAPAAFDDYLRGFVGQDVRVWSDLVRALSTHDAKGAADPQDHLKRRAAAITAAISHPRFTLSAGFCVKELENFAIEVRKGSLEQAYQTLCGAIRTALPLEVGNGAELLVAVKMGAWSRVEFAIGPAEIRPADVGTARQLLRQALRHHDVPLDIVHGLLDGCAALSRRRGIFGTILDIFRHGFDAFKPVPWINETYRDNRGNRTRLYDAAMGQGLKGLLAQYGAAAR